MTFINMMLAVFCGLGLFSACLGAVFVGLSVYRRYRLNKMFSSMKGDSLNG